MSHRTVERSAPVAPSIRQTFYDGDPELMAAMGVALMQVQLAGLIEGNPKPDVEAISRELCRQLEPCFRRDPRLDAPDALAS